MGAPFGWPNGVVGMATGSLAGLLVLLHAIRQAPWDIHDERSYAEPKKLTIGVVAPPLVLFSALLTLMLGLGAVDRSIGPELGMAGDILGLIALPFGLAHFCRLLK